MIKKIIMLYTSVFMIFLLGGCNNDPKSAEIGTGTNSNNTNNNGVVSNTAINAITESTVKESEENDLSTEFEQSESSTDTVSGSDILIAYFSWSGHTKQIAEEIQKLTGGDICEITPTTPYTDDIDELSGIALQEQRDNSRPPLTSHVDDIGKYNTVFVGYPNWWNNMPMPVFTFLEEYDFSGKIVIPFTSYGNGVFGKSINSLKETLPDSIIEEGFAVQEHEFEDMPQEVCDWFCELDRQLQMVVLLMRNPRSRSVFQTLIYPWNHNTPICRTNNFIYINQLFHAMRTPANNSRHRKDRCKQLLWNI